ncbi:MAG: alpha-1,4-glucan--maltose-1-phosphate maltosyltransferase [Hyphomicrobiaceae bacterium]
MASEQANCTTEQAKKSGRSEVIRQVALPDLDELAQSRVAIEAVCPEIDGGRFPAKRIVGDAVTVEADIFAEGHDRIDAAVLYRRTDAGVWNEAPMRHVDNDRWRSVFRVTENALYVFTIIAWHDAFGAWCDEVTKKRAAGLGLDLEIKEGTLLVRRAADDRTRGSVAERKSLCSLADEIEQAPDHAQRLHLLLGERAADLYGRAGPRTHLTTYAKTLPVWVDRPRAAFSAWYEMFPRSQSGDVARHGTFDDVIRRLPYVRDMGFDVLYFTPIHPIGSTNRKGRNNSLVAAPGDPGSPYAIGSSEGGHDAIHRELGSFDDFARLVSAAHEHGLEIALDFAIQCSPDHPWIKAHPEWFDWRPDGTIRFAENPPKKYEDIVNVRFDREAYPAIWHALRDVVLFWAERGVRIFRVDNPHTKPYPFWEWMIAEVRTQYPDTLFLSEAFTRPKVMQRLAKLGFTQSYSYFTWRNTKAELTEYMTQLTRTEMREYFRPNFFANTPDINPVYLQSSGRAGFQARLVLAATLAGNYGLYNGFEICESQPLPGKEEYADSEKYEIKVWDWDRKGHIREDIKLVNRLRRERPALQTFVNLAFYNAWNDKIIYYAKFTDDRRDFVLIAVNLDPHGVQGAHFEVPLWEFGLDDEASVDVEDLRTGERFEWAGKVQHMLLDPQDCPYRMWRITAKQRDVRPE